jgi:excisionase family DNA binding protein
VVITMATDILTIKEVAVFLKLTEKTAYRLAADGKIPGFKVGGSWRFRRDEIEKMTRSKESNKKKIKS